MKKKIFFFLLPAVCVANPLFIDIPPKKEFEEEDFVALQNTLRTVDIRPAIDAIYPKDIPFSWPWQKSPVRKKSDFEGRISRGVRQTVIDLPNGKKPIKQLIKINKGGDRCIVSFASYDGVYPDRIQSIPEALTKTGFDGYFLMMIGGFPNPTGEEASYASVPYSFKIFALLEAQKRGFDKALWIDSSFLPLKNPDPLFQRIEKTGSFFQKKKNGSRYLLSATRNILLEKTGIDMYKTDCIRARVIGLDFRTDSVKTLIREYYELVKLGTPFFSCFPEEFVLGALVAKHPEDFSPELFPDLVQQETKQKRPSVHKESFFLMRKH